MLFIIIFGTLPIPITGLRGVSICWLLRNQTLSIDHWTVKNAPRRHCDISNACYGTHATHYSSNIRYVGGGCLALLGIHPIISSPPATYAGRVTDPPGHIHPTHCHGRRSGHFAPTDTCPRAENYVPSAHCLTSSSSWQIHRHLPSTVVIKRCLFSSNHILTVLFCSLAVLGPRVGHTMDVYFHHLSLSSVIVADSSTESPVHVLMLSIQAVRTDSIY